ncbi:MAG: TonB-dependent siderophore receptor [Rhodocyclaceae bacterium]|nr:TonB-dependent siderophore receptor [Rhodocyclaceae bacterium]
MNTATHLAGPRAAGQALRPLTLAIAAALALPLALPAHAQDTTVGAHQPASRQYAIPAGDLDHALGLFGQQSGELVSVDARLTEGRSSPGLDGRYASADALSRLLAGSSLEAFQGQDGTWRLREVPAASRGDATLAAVTVTASAERSGITEGTGSYTQTGPSSTATKLNLTLRETPQSISVLTRQRMDDQAMETLEDVIENTPGIVLSKAGGERPAIYSRGFWLQKMTYDGLTGAYDGDYVGSPNLAMYDRVEIVRGSTGLTTGAGTPSAAINMVRKKPTRDFQLNLTGSIGSWDNYRTDVDVAGPLNQHGSLRGRAVLSYQDKDSFTDVVNNKSGLVYAILEADLGPRTMLSFGGSYQKDDNRNTWGGVPWAADGSDLHLPRSSYFGYDWEYWDKENKEVFIELQHRFANDWALRLAGRKGWSRMAYLGTHLTNYNTWAQIGAEYDAHLDTSSYDLNASGPFTLLGREHELVLGASFQESDKLLAGGQGTIRSTGIDVYNWDSGSLARPAFDLGMLRNNYLVEQRSAYATSRLNPHDDWKIILGARLDWYQYDASTSWMGNASVSGYKVTRNLTKYAGVIYDLDDRHSVYASYTDIFEPQSQSGFSGKLLDPILGKNYELGIKGEYFGGTLNTSAALFQIDQVNRAALAQNQAGCPINNCYEASGKVRSKGVELEVSGALSPNWNLAAGYTYTDAKYIRNAANTALEGTRFDTAFPEHLFKLSTLYRLPGNLNQWRVGAGIQWQSEIYKTGVNAGTPFRIEQKTYAVADLTLGYQASKNVDVQLNIDNLFDKRYYHSLGSHPGWGGVARYGMPRNFMMMVKYQL